MQASEESNPATYTSAVRLFRVSHRLFLSQLLHLADLEKSPVYWSFLGCCDKILYWVAWWVSTHFLPVLESGRTWPSIGMGWLSWGLSLSGLQTFPVLTRSSLKTLSHLLFSEGHSTSWTGSTGQIAFILFESPPVKTPDPIKGHMLGSWDFGFQHVNLEGYHSVYASVSSPIRNKV